LGLGRSVRCGIAELAQFGLKCSLNVLSIRCRKLVLERKHPLRPGGKSLGLVELLQLGDQLVLEVFGGISRQCCRLGPLGAGSFFAGRTLFRPLRVLLGFGRESCSGQVGRIEIILAGNPYQGEQGITAGIGEGGS
jgi:hypothetical protein